MNEHTPGPWRFVDDVSPMYQGVIALVECSEPDKVVGIVSDATEWVPREQWVANARLIAAAPELLELIQQQIAAMNSGPMTDLSYAGIEWLHRAKDLLSRLEAR